DMCVYNNVVSDGIDGFLASNDEEWIEKIEKLILDESLRKTIRGNALNKVLSDYMIDDRINEWDIVLTK
ncbi:MAG: glycosyltransferase family 1 protein, partial [Methanobrevibacter sp.]|nr:glycosyltransferase family 1 protein [Methanobrevibacter sp.]